MKLTKRETAIFQTADRNPPRFARETFDNFENFEFEPFPVTFLHDLSLYHWNRKIYSANTCPGPLIVQQQQQRRRTITIYFEPGLRTSVLGSNHRRE